MSNRIRVFLFAGGFVWLAGLASYPLLESTEGRYASVAWTMNHGGGWVEPMFDGHPLFTKPPLAYWSGALALKLLPDTAWAVRLPATFMLLLCALLTRQLALIGGLDRRRAKWAGVMAFLSPIAVAQGRMTTGDIFLWAGILLAFVCLFDEQKSSKLRAVGLGLGLAMGFMVKGHMVLLWVILPVAIRAVMAREDRHRMRRLLHPLTWMIFLGLAAPWFTLIILRHHDLLDFWLVRETADRVVTDVHGRGEPWWYFLPQLPLLVLPWWPELWRSLKNRADGVTLRAFLLIWIVAPLIVFSLATSKRPNYLLPMVTPLAILTAAGLPLRPRAWFYGRTAAWAMVILAYPFILGAFHLAPRTQDMVQAARQAQRPLATFQIQPSSLAFYHHGPVLAMPAADPQSVNHFMAQHGLILARCRDLSYIRDYLGTDVKVFKSYGKRILVEQDTIPATE